MGCHIVEPPCCTYRFIFSITAKVRLSYPITSLEKQLGSRRLELPEFLDSRHMKMVLLALRTPSFTLQGDPRATYYYEGRVDPRAIVRPEGLG
jgi:hypothetical protein